MSEKKNDGGNAFPFQQNFPSQEGNYSKLETGMTLRDYFAAHAIHSMVHLGIEMVKSGTQKQADESHIAQAAYAIADAMIVEKNK